ncbi:MULTISPECIES: hypothetical protein [unclassified Schlesneria]|uniref:hypothetical protein n=1 Tax=Schlesneria TaxID=656899 RepID=UPI002F0EB3AA
MMNEISSSPDRREALKRLCLIGAAGSLVSVAGCSKLLLGGGKILFGDPKITSEFTTLTRIDLSKGEHTVAVVCSTPESVESNASALKLDVIDGVSRRLKLNGVKIINPDRVADWVEANGGIGSDLTQLAQDFETDYIAWIDIQSFGLREPNSQNLLRGQTTGFIRVAKVEDVSGWRRPMMAYTREFALTYPQHQPISETGRSIIVFHKEYVARLCDMLAERFYNHRPGKSF